jgi:hypothetical protein
MAPKEEPAFGQCGYGNPDVVQGKLFFFPEASFAIEKIAVSDTEGKMYNGCGPITRQEHDQPDAQEENDLHQAEEEVYPGHQEQFPARQHQDENIHGDEKLAPEIDVGHFPLMDMAKGMTEDKKGGSSVKPSAGMFQLLERWMNDREGYRIHTAVIYPGMRMPGYSIKKKEKIAGNCSSPA